MNINQFIKDPKNRKYIIYSIIGLVILLFIGMVSSCNKQPRQSPLQVQQPVVYQEPVQQYPNQYQQPTVIHNHYENSNTAGTMATAAAVGAATAYATNKYMDKQKQPTTTVTSIPVKKPNTQTVSKPVVTTKPSFSYTTNKPSNVYRSTSTVKRK